MSKLKAKSEALYQKLRRSRERLVEKYKAGGTIRYDEAIGLIPVGGNPAVSTAATTLGGAPVVNTGRREKRIPDMKEDGTVGTATGRVVIDFDAIKAANIADGIASGSMMDALKKRAEGKTVLLFANDAGLRYGTCILGEVECMVQLQGNLDGLIRNGVFPGFGPTTQIGMIHSMPGFVENEGLTHRGLAKPANYRADVDSLKNPVSIWSEKDGSGQPFMLFGINSEIRLWGKNQVIDLNGFRIGAHERPNRVAAFSSIIDFSNGHFAGLTTKSASNCHLFSSTGVGRLARNNHFALRGHFVKGLLVEGIVSGDASTLNQGSYFGSAIFNDCQEIVFKDFHQEMLNKAVSNSSMALSWYAQLTMPELLRGYFERAADWATTGAAYPWMKWDNIAAGAVDTFGNGKTSQFPVIKSEAELQAAGVPADKTALVRRSLLAMQEAHRKSMKAADDTYIQVNTGHGIIGKSFPMVSNKMTAARQIPRSSNLIAQNPKNTEGTRYPDSVAYGFRVGSSSEGVGKLSTARGGTVQDIYLLDCTFSGQHLSPMEALSFGRPDAGTFKTFNGNGIRPFGYTNTLEDAVSMAPATALMSKAAIEAAAPKTKLEAKPVDSFDTAAAAVANTSETGWTAEKASGLYKGNDVVEAGLAALEAVGLLKRYFTAALPQSVLSGTDNSNLDIGVLAWRKSMMVAIDALTANHVGLKGGYEGDIKITDAADAYRHGEIYPWYVKSDLSVSIDKDVILTQPAVAASPTKDRTLSSPYLAAALPAPSDSLFKLKLVNEDTMWLVKADSEARVTYQECADLLGFTSASAASPAMTSFVEYKIARNVDGQNHTHKGSFGARADQASDVFFSRLVIKDHQTVAKAPTQGLGSVAAQEVFGLNADNRPQSGVLDIHGISLNGVTGVEVDSCLVADCDSRGNVFAVEVSGKSNDVSIENSRAENLIAGQGGEFKAPFGDQKSIGVRVVDGCSEIQLKKIRSKQLSAARPELAKSVEIECEEAKLS